jgi:mRNA-degrading endonuclease RelE of RelBE toxin-antitoxin system
MSRPPTRRFKLVPLRPYERDVKKQCKQNKALLPIVKDMQRILTIDPYNRTRIYDIKKLTDMQQGEAQYRIRSGDFRILYDIVRDDVLLYAFKNRKDAY